MKHTLTDKQREILEREATWETTKEEKGWSVTLYPIYGRHEHKSARSLENRDLARIVSKQPHEHNFIKVRDEVWKAVKAAGPVWQEDVVIEIGEEAEETLKEQGSSVYTDSVKKQHRSKLAKTAILNGLVKAKENKMLKAYDIALMIETELMKALTLRLPKKYDVNTDTDKGLDEAIANFKEEMKRFK